MASLAEREGLRGKVQCIFFDPPYGIKFNSNWQVSTLSRDVKDGKQTDVSREPEQIKAFRDTWKDGDSLIPDLFAGSVGSVLGSFFLMAAVYLCRLVTRTCIAFGGLMDEVFGTKNFGAMIVVPKVTGS